MDLSALTKPTSKPPMLTIVGSPGAGKTSLGALFPNAIIIQAEEGSSVFDTWEDDVKPTVFPPLPRARSDKSGKVAGTLDAILDQLRALITQEHGFKTVVIDSVTALHTLFENEVCVKYGTDNIGEAAGGYGKGFLEVKEMHGKVKNACDHLKAKGITVVFLAHSGVKKIRNSPEAEEHSVYSLDMHDASIPYYTNLVDGVIYIRQEEFVKGQQSDKKGNTTKFGKIINTGKRILVTSGDGKVGYVNSKNRYDLPPEIEIDKGENPLLDLIPYFINNK